MADAKQKKSAHKERVIQKKVDEYNRPLSELSLAEELQENIRLFQSLFENDQTLKIREIGKAHHGKGPRYAVLFCDGLIDTSMMNDSIIKPLLLTEVKPEKLQTIAAEVLQVNEVASSNDLSELVQAVTFGDTILLMEGQAEALILNSKGFATRGITEPEAERILTGPREGFCESIMLNLSMLHRRLRTNELKMQFLTIGRRTATQVCVCYMDTIVNKDILDRVMRQLNEIDIDGILDSNYLTEFIEDSTLSPFRTTGSTERPDVVVGKLLEGRIAILVDGTPVVVTVPYLFIENFQSSEDYYVNYYYASLSRVLRLRGLIRSRCLPGRFIDIITDRPEIIPELLFINMASERQAVPLPAPLEIFIMLIIFDILRETGIRMPSNVGQALSIVGALVIGQTAVEAKLVASTMLIVVAMTGVTSLLVPRMNAPIILVRNLVLLLSTMLGLFGFILGMCGVLIHILSLRSMGIPQLSPNHTLNMQKMKDNNIRAPWPMMLTRSSRLTRDVIRQRRQKR
ncbi:MAG: spore germination protein [Clostridiales bacterium]|nr:spore germination protein [Clostridiales bacterium]